MEGKKIIKLPISVELATNNLTNKSILNHNFDFIGKIEKDTIKIEL